MQKSNKKNQSAEAEAESITIKGVLAQTALIF
jgi:hypothetical protein